MFKILSRLGLTSITEDGAVKLAAGSIDKKWGAYLVLHIMVTKEEKSIFDINKWRDKKLNAIMKDLVLSIRCKYLVHHHIAETISQMLESKVNVNIISYYRGRCVASAHRSLTQH